MSCGFILLTRCLLSHQPDTSWHCSLNRANELWQFISNCPAQTFKCPPQSTNEPIWLPLGMRGRSLLIHIRFGSMSDLIYHNSWDNTLVPLPLSCGERRGENTSSVVSPGRALVLSTLLHLTLSSYTSLCGTLKSIHFFQQRCSNLCKMWNTLINTYLLEVGNLQHIG